LTQPPKDSDLVLASPGSTDNEAVALLTVQGLSKHFGSLKAVREVSFDVRQGQIFSIIGPNGAGKTTVFHVLTGLSPATAGDAFFCGTRILGLPAHKITELGIARTYQLIRVFKDMTVLENVQVGTHCRTRSGVWDALALSPRARREEEFGVQRSLELLELAGIAEYSGQEAQNLPYGAQRRLEIARALATEPKLLLLDEPTAGMNPAEKGDMMSLIQTIRQNGITVLLVEHDMHVVMGISDWIVVLDHGEKIAEGTPKEVQCTECVIEAYLGRGYGQ